MQTLPETAPMTRGLASPVGPLVLEARNGALCALRWGHVKHQSEAGAASGEDALLDEAARQIEAYFAGQLTRFDLPLHLPEGDLLQAVLRQMLDIPHGETRTYGEVARAVGSAPQPVGQACGANPLPILVPCHRILSAKGLGGYSGGGGLETKIALLKLENAYPFLL